MEKAQIGHQIDSSIQPIVVAFSKEQRLTSARRQGHGGGGSAEGRATPQKRRRGLQAQAQRRRVVGDRKPQEPASPALSRTQQRPTAHSLIAGVKWGARKGKPKRGEKGFQSGMANTVRRLRQAITRQVTHALESGARPFPFRK